MTHSPSFLYLSPGEKLQIYFVNPEDVFLCPEDVVTIEYHDGFDQVEINHEPTNHTCNLTYFFTTHNPEPKLKEEEERPVYFLTTDKSDAASQCRQMGISVGDTIEGQTPSGGELVRLKLLYLGAQHCVWLVKTQIDASDFGESYESSTMSLQGRFWRIVPRSELD